MEHRHPQTTKSAPLPVDYLRMVNEVFTTNFDAGLKAMARIKPGPVFQAEGAIFPSELVLSLSLVHKDAIAATTAYASMDFDPKASSPTVEDLLSSCVDALGALWLLLLDTTRPERLKQVAAETLAAMDGIPMVWTASEFNKRQVYLLVDKSNPNLDRLADDWLAKHDPDAARRRDEEQRATAELFVTGPKKPVKH